MRPVQHFSRDYLRRSSAMRPEQVLRFLEEFRVLNASRAPKPALSRLISLRVPEALLEAFKTNCRLRGIAYQTEIKRLMRAWLDRSP